MSLTNTTNNIYNVTLDGLTTIDADIINIDGQTLDPASYVTYTGATQDVDLGFRTISSMDTNPTTYNLINKTYLDNQLTSYYTKSESDDKFATITGISSLVSTQTLTSTLLSYDTSSTALSKFLTITGSSLLVSLGTLTSSLSNYVTLSTGSSYVTGATLSSNLSNYLTLSTGLSYITGATLTSTLNNYITATTSSAYLTTGTAAGIYATLTSFSNLSTTVNSKLSISDAASTYLTQSNASSTYLAQSNAASTYGTITGLSALSSNKVNKAGDTMTGDLTVNATVQAYSLLSNKWSRWEDYREGMSPFNQPSAAMGYYFGTHSNNDDGSFSDLLCLNGWADSSGGNVNLISFNKGGKGIRQYQGTHGSKTNFSTYYDCVMTEENSSNVVIGGTCQVNSSFYVGTNGNASSQIYFGGVPGDAAYDHTVIECRKYSEAGEGSELLLFKGNDIQDGSLVPDRIRLRAANICFDTYPYYSTDRTAENIRMIIKQDGKVGIGTTSPDGKLHVALAGDGTAYWDRFIVKTTSFWGDGCSSRSETAGNQYATMYPMMFLNPHVVSDTDGWCYIRMGRAGGVAGGNWWEIANRSDGYFQIGAQRSNQLSIHPNGAVNVCGGSPYAVPNGRMASGSLTIGSTDRNYGGGTGSWNSNTAGLMLECADNTEIAIHDSGTRLVSALYYQGAQNFISIGRNMGEGSPAYVLVPTSFIANRISVVGDDASGRLNIQNPNGSYTHFGYSDNRNYIRNNTIFDSGYVEIGASYVFRAPLDITTTVGRDNGAVRYFDYWGGLGFTNWYSYSSMQDTAGASRFMAYSDIRKKKNIKPVENVLEKIDKLNIVSYDHIDITQPHNYFGIIAQEVEVDYPQMINKGLEFLPNIYEEATAHMCTKCGEFVILEMKSNINLNHVGKKLKLITFDEELKKEYDEYTEIIAITDNRMKVKIWKKQGEVQYEARERVLVYGTCEDDVLTVDKSQFGIMAVAGVQELKKQNEEMKQIIDLQNKKINELEAIIVQHNQLLTAIVEKLNN